MKNKFKPIPPDKIKLFVMKYNEGHENECLTFKIKTTTRLSKLMEAYCTRLNVSIQKHRFIFNERIICSDDTPDKLGDRRIF